MFGPGNVGDAFLKINLREGDSSTSAEGKLCVCALHVGSPKLAYLLETDQFVHFHLVKSIFLFSPVGFEGNLSLLEFVLNLFQGT